MHKILLVDDEQRMLDLLSLYLTPKGYHCIKMTSAEAALHYLETDKADLLLLDVMMPEMDGFTACSKIRKASDIPIIMLTARGEKADVVRGLKLGADDYISKPFDEAELTARIEAILRRKHGGAKTIECNGLMYKQDSFELSYGTRPVPLTPKEFSLLGLFLQHPNKVFTREHLLTSIWGYSAATEDRTVDSHVRNIREKLRKAGFPVDEYLTTVWGLGYKWVDKES
ncbi:response regulator transcription factor [Neobacillus sp. SM06]|uniref:response regulator transcription factor n=1 Tax=Neobacillus sp. SM06 TaxID=3422492 RepID=UPI003D2C2F5A